MKLVDPNERQPAEGSYVFAVKKLSSSLGGYVGVLKYENGNWRMPDSETNMHLDQFYWIDMIER